MYFQNYNIRVNICKLYLLPIALAWQWFHKSILFTLFLCSIKLRERERERENKIKSGRVELIKVRDRENRDIITLGRVERIELRESN